MINIFTIFKQILTHKTCTSAQDFSERLNHAKKLRDHICVLEIRLKLLCDEVEPHGGNYSKINNANIMKLFLMICFFPQ